MLDKKKSYIVVGVLVIAVGLILCLAWQEYSSIPESPIITKTETAKPEKEMTGLLAENKAIEKAAENQDAASCENIESEGRRQWCEENVIMRKAINESDVQVCNEIGREEGKISCRDSFFLSQAITEGKESICEKISTQPGVNQCKENMARLKY